MLLAPPALHAFFYTCPGPSPREDRDSPTLRQARSALRPLSPTHLTLLLLAAWLGARVRCRRLAAAITDLATVAALTAAIVTAGAALAVDVTSAFVAAVIARLGHQRIGML